MCLSVTRSRRWRLKGGKIGQVSKQKCGSGSSAPAGDDAKITLGERGDPWREPPTEQSLAIRLEAIIRCLLRSREHGRTTRTSEAAQIVGSDQWRDLLPANVEHAWALERRGWLHVTQKGERLSYPITGAVGLRRR